MRAAAAVLPRASRADGPGAIDARSAAALERAMRHAKLMKFLGGSV